MAISYMDVRVLQKALTGAWKNELHTKEDPANGKWYTNGANNDGIGLYGGLTDALPTALVFDTSRQNNIPRQIVCANQTIDNRNGLTPVATPSLSYSYQDTTSYSQTVTTGINLGYTQTVSINALFVEASYSLNVEFNWSIAKQSGQTTSQTYTVTLPVTTTVPAGKVYQVVLLGSQMTVQVPYTADITVTGTTETWFEDRVKGAYRHTASAGEAFGWVNQFNTAGSDSPYFGQNGDQGLYKQYGTVTAVQMVNFMVQTTDVTSQYSSTTPSPRAVQPGTPAVAGSMIVNEMPVALPSRNG